MVKQPIKIQIRGGPGNRYYSSLVEVTQNGLAFGDKYVNSIGVSKREWDRLMKLRRATMRTGNEWRPKAAPLPDDRMAHHFGTVFTDHGLSYFVSRIGPKGPIDLKAYDGNVQDPRDKHSRNPPKWAPDVRISTVSIDAINKTFKEQEKTYKQTQ